MEKFAIHDKSQGEKTILELVEFANCVALEKMEEEGFGKERNNMQNRKIESHECRYEDGRLVTVHIFQEFRTITDLSGKTEEIPGTRRCVFPDGSPVNYQDENTFVTLDGETLTRV